MLSIPAPLKAELDALERALSCVVNGGGRLGAAARCVDELIHPHFAREEDGLRPLGILADIAAGRSVPDAPGVIALTEQLKKQGPLIEADQKAIGRALDDLAAAAAEVGDASAGALAERLQRHILCEAEILYPAALLVGAALKQFVTREPTRARWPERLV
ncbi:hemerythrin domain-containing protein [Microvirga antarctica]|uniref:hemerythrin domain-containing protein n=1 Tax=Microvirga antarctica TaxID=2819233 RepID=UPI001B317F67|nr:hemerythrin domain-containing protein [Microvirga antarctica]